MPNWKKVAVSGSSPAFNNITASGNISASGFVSASSFSGDGSGLTGVPFSGAQTKFNVFQTGSGTNSIKPVNGSNENGGTGSTIGGGASNVISNHGECSGILSGQSNKITSSFANVSSGNDNNRHSVIAGGHNNIINVCRTAGESQNNPQGCHAIVGGECNEIFVKNTTSGNNFIGGGSKNKITGSGVINDSSIVGGCLNFIGSTITGGVSHNTSYTIIGGGLGNCIGQHDFSSILGGRNNKISYHQGAYGCYNSIVGGYSNMITGSSIGSFIGGGEDNIIRPGSGTNQHNSILGGKGNEIKNDAQCSIIIGGVSNTIDYAECATVIGTGNSLDSSTNGIIAIGHGMTLSNINNKVVLSNLCIYGTDGTDGEIKTGKGIFGTIATIIDDNIVSTGNFELTGSIYAKTDITASGNISASGFVSASSFSGDGSGLTGITITTPSLQDVTDEGSSTTTSITTSNITSTGTISGSVLKSELFCVYQPGTSSPSILFDNSGSATGLAKITAQSSGAGSGGSLNFCTTVSPATSPAAHMNLRNGNLGIGIVTANPAGKLDVRGNITSSGYVKASCFIGSGSGLTNVTGSLNIVGNTGTSDSGTAISVTNTQKITFSGNAVTSIAPTNPGVIAIDINTGSASTTGVFEAGTGTTNIIPSLGSNVNTGTFSTIAGGCQNTIDTNGDLAFIGGGKAHSSSGDYTFIGGGQQNCTQGSHSVIGGGTLNIATSCSVAGGGKSNLASACYASILGGINNKIDAGAKCSSIGGGELNHIFGLSAGSSYLNKGGSCSTIGGGKKNCIRISYSSTIGGGHCNRISGSESGNYDSHSTIGGGRYHVVTGATSTIAGGGGNNINRGYSSTIGGGYNNQNNGSNSTIGGGMYNLIANPACFQGSSNLFAPGSATVAGGYNNRICACISNFSVIAGGGSNKICNTSNSANVTSGGILGGESNIVCCQKSFIIGSNITTTTACTTFMNNGVVACHLQVGGLTPCGAATTGRIDATNDVVAFSSSDKRLKENIKPISNALCKLNEVSGNTFNWKKLNKEQIKNIHGNTGKDVGVIAQEIESILPEAVTTRDSGYKAVNYEKLIPLLIEAIKDQQKQIDELKSRI